METGVDRQSGDNNILYQQHEKVLELHILYRC